MSKQIAIIIHAAYGWHEHVGMSLVLGISIPQFGGSVQGGGLNLVGATEIRNLFEYLQAESVDDLIGKALWIDSEGLGTEVKYLEPCKLE